MDNVFIITSAINPNIGSFSHEDRFHQTLATIFSIRQKVENSKIILVDTSISGIGTHYTKKLLRLVDLFIDLSNDEVINNIRTTASLPNVDMNGNSIHSPDICSIKSLSEMRIMLCVLPILKNQSNILRIFKISGRYWLSEHFYIGDYDYTTKDKYVFKSKNYSTVLHHPLYDYELTGKIFYQLCTRLWSFDYSLLEETITMFNNMFNDMIEILSNGKFIDLEHSMYKFIDIKKLSEFETIGLAGIWDLNNSLIIE